MLQIAAQQVIFTKSFHVNDDTQQPHTYTPIKYASAIDQFTHFGVTVWSMLCTYIEHFETIIPFYCRCDCARYEICKETILESCECFVCTFIKPVLDTLTNICNFWFSSGEFQLAKKLGLEGILVHLIVWRCIYRPITHEYSEKDLHLSLKICLNKFHKPEIPLN